MKLCNDLPLPLPILLPTLPFWAQQPPGEICKRKHKQCLRGHHKVFSTQFRGVKLPKAKQKLKKT